MTHAAPRHRGGKTWILPTLAVLGVAGFVVLGLLSRAIVLDAASWWPLWLILGGLGLWGRGMKLGALRVPGLVAIAAVLAIGVFIVAHLQGWPFLPSAAGYLEGSPVGRHTVAALSARVPNGALVVESGEDGPLYTVEAIRRGGDVAIATAVERSQESSVSIELEPVEGREWLLWSGWQLGLAEAPAWTLTLEGDVDADLRGVRVDNLQVIGSGNVLLGTTSRSTPVSISGDFVVEVAAEMPVRIIGPAQIPESWTRTESGAASPYSGQGWVISVAEGSVVRVIER